MNMPAYALPAEPEPSDGGYDHTGEKVSLAWVHLNDSATSFTESLLRMAAYDKAHGNYLLHNSGVDQRSALNPTWGRGGQLDHARNAATAQFLASDAEWLMWIDTDMGWEPNALEKLLVVADAERSPIVGGLCFIETDYSHDHRGGLRSSLQPTLYDWVWMEPSGGVPGCYKMLPRSSWPENSVTRVGATGAAFLLTHRSVYEKISAWCQEQGAPPSIWWQRIPGPDGELCGEDVSLCLRAHQVGIPVLVHTGVEVTHQKTVWWGAQDYRQRPYTPPMVSSRLLSPDEWPKLQVNRQAVQDTAARSPMTAPAVARTRMDRYRLARPPDDLLEAWFRKQPHRWPEIAVIVPVAQRDNARTFLSSLRDSLEPAQRHDVWVYLMADRHDREVIEAWSKAAGELYPSIIINKGIYEPFDGMATMGTFAQKANRGYRISDEPWLFVVGDDVRFHPGWLDHAMSKAGESTRSVIGTNDLGNPRVMSGEHATHFFVLRRYVDEQGASFDGPGVLCHEGYRHWYVDDEIIELAKRRGQFAPCLDAVVEHLHPLFGKGEPDDVYRIGGAAAERDERLWAARLKEYPNA